MLGMPVGYRFPGRRLVDALVEAVRAAYPRLSHRYYQLKARWMGFYDGAGIHGTDDIGSLGSAASPICAMVPTISCPRIMGYVR